MRISDWSSDVCSSDLGEAAGGAEALDRRRRQREGEAVLDLHEPAVHPPGDSACGILGAALAPVLQSDEGEAGILAGAGEAEAGDRHDALHRRLLPEGGLDLLDHLEGPVGARLAWRLHVDQQEALVLVRQEGCRELEPRPAEAGEESQVDHHIAPRSEEHTSELQSLMRNSYAVLCLKK